jgi:two-component system, OmpR family, sensor histidine kinase BaeS
MTAERLHSLHDETDRIGKLVDDLHLLFVADSKNLVQKKHPVKPLAILQELIGAFETLLMQAAHSSLGGLPISIKFPLVRT